MRNLFVFAGLAIVALVGLSDLIKPELVSAVPVRRGWWENKMDENIIATSSGLKYIDVIADALKINVGAAESRMTAV